jgi:CheY-like chemotaxis protein
MRRLLIIDDQREFAAYIRDVAEMQGYDVASAHSVREARPVFETFQPDVIMLDMVMPEEDGLRFLEWMRDQSLRPRVMVMSGFHQMYTSLACKFCDAYGLGPVQVLAKPIALGDLRAALQVAAQAA